MPNPTCPTCGVGVREHEALRCLDAWVAQAMGHDIVCYAAEDDFWVGVPVETESIGPDDYPVPRYCGDVGAAWQIVESLVHRGYCPGLVFDDNGHWALSLEGVQNVPLGDDPEDISTTFFIKAGDWCDTPQIAIVRAVILAMEGKDD